MFDCEYGNRKSFFLFTTSVLFLPPRKKKCSEYIFVCVLQMYSSTLYESAVLLLTDD